MPTVPSVIEELRISLSGIFDDPVQDAVEHNQKHVEECRNGDYHGVGCLLRVRNLELFLLEDIDLTEEQLDEFVKQAREAAQRYASEILTGHYEHVDELRALIDDEIVSYAEVSLTARELNHAAHMRDVERCQKTLEVARKEEKFDDDFLFLLDAVGTSQVTPEELDTDMYELTELTKQCNYQRLGEALDDCRNGEYEKISWLVMTIRMLELIEPVYEEVDTSPEEVEELLNRARFARAKEVADECRERNYDELDALVNAVQDGHFSREQLDELTLDLEGWKAGRAQQRFGPAAEECRNGEFQQLPMLEMAVANGEISDGLAAELDLDIDRWKRQVTAEAAKSALAGDELGMIAVPLAVFLNDYAAEDIGLTKRQFRKLMGTRLRDRVRDRFRREPEPDQMLSTLL